MCTDNKTMFSYSSALKNVNCLHICCELYFQYNLTYAISFEILKLSCSLCSCINLSQTKQGVINYALHKLLELN